MACGADLVQACDDEQLLLFIELVQVLRAALIGELHVRHNARQGMLHTWQARMQQGWTLTGRQCGLFRVALHVVPCQAAWLYSTRMSHEPGRGVSRPAGPGVTVLLRVSDLDPVVPVQRTQGHRIGGQSMRSAHIQLGQHVGPTKRDNSILVQAGAAPGRGLQTRSRSCPGRQTCGAG